LLHKERLERLLSDLDIDRPAISAWRHFYDNELTAEDLADMMLGFQQKFDWDFMKINPRACYHVEDWGVSFNYSGVADEKSEGNWRPVQEYAAVKTEDDWLKIKPLEPEVGCFGEQLKAVDLIKKGLDGKLDFVQTVFSPLSIAADLTKSENIFKEFMESGINLEPALESITFTLEKYVARLLQIGVSGIFFATTQWATRDNISEEQYLQYGKPYDLRVLKTAGKAKFNILHVCKQFNMLTLFKDYPVDIINWSKHEPGNMDFSQADKIFSQVFLGGMDHIQTLVEGSPRDVITQLEDALADAGDHPLIIGPGCSLKPGTPYENLQVMRDSVNRGAGHG
jgi:uroporphyrinogen decarboxylase